MSLEEFDGIIIQNLREEKIVDESITRLADFTPEVLYSTVIRCIKAIQQVPNLPFPNSLPRAMGQRTNVCSGVVKLIKEDLQYPGNLTYDQLLYTTNINETRNLLKFLVEQFPEPEITKETTEVSFADRLNDIIKVELKSVLKEPWSASAQRNIHLTRVSTFTTNPLRSAYFPGGLGKNQTLEKFVRVHLPFITEQPTAKPNIPPSILEHNLQNFAKEKEREKEFGQLDPSINVSEYRRKKKADLTKRMGETLRLAVVESGGSESGSFNMSLADVLTSMESTNKVKRGGKFQLDASLKDSKANVNAPKIVKQEEDEQAIAEKRRKEIEELDELIKSTEESLDRTEHEIDSFGDTIRQLESGINAENQKQEELKKRYLNEKQAYDLLPDAEQNIKKLRSRSAANAQKLIDLANQWESVRVPLIEDLRQAREMIVNKKDDGRTKIEKIRDMMKQRREIIEEIDSKNDKYTALLNHYKTLPSSVNRGFYTRRILDILKNVKRQKAEIDKVLIDTRNLMKEIALNGDSLRRTFSVTSDLMYADAKKDAVLKSAYKDLVAMDKSFQRLVGVLEETGATKNGVLELKVKIEQNEGRITKLNRERIAEDLDNIKKENAKLAKQLKESQ
eukprot:TRINITY_DN6551_c0_g1_i1.p1 TRINITY_DN6551_c0_g1~~TRINITY_DN6551_c0_g1_i1.p1  ORF type:complete len:621 (-),score=150.17 TRINITY_DN6551_c0_g1_i1:7-1869(-)